MSITSFAQDKLGVAKVVELVTAEREKALSPREWRHRIAGYGFGLEVTKEGLVITALPKGEQICRLPEEFAV